MNHLLYVMKVLQKFRTLRAKRRARALAASSTLSLDNQQPSEDKAKAEEIEALLEQRRRMRSQDDSEGQGDPELLFLGIGTGSRDDFAMDQATPNIVADSPTAVDFNVFDRAYDEAIEQRLKLNTERRPTLFLNKFVKGDGKLNHIKSVSEGDNDDLTKATSEIDLTSQQES